MNSAVDSRDLRIDSTTGLLMVFVVFGHVLETMSGAAAHAAVLWVYMFHMPAFVFMSGYVTRYVSRWSPVNIVKRLLFPFVVFALLQRGLSAVWDGHGLVISSPVVPYTLWYLLALTAWRFTVPLLTRLSIGVALPAAVLVSILAAGASWIGLPYALGRTVGFFPFFVAGALWRDEWWRWALSRWSRITAAAVVIASVLCVVAMHEHIRRVAFTYARSPESRGISPAFAMAERGVVILVGATLALSVIVLAMRVIPVLASVGVATLTVYLLHAIVIFPWHKEGAPGWFYGEWAVLVAALASAVLAWLLSRRPVVTATRPLMDFAWWEARVRRARTKRADT